MRQFDDSFAKLIGRPCWGVRRGYGSLLTLEFGAPSLWVHEPLHVGDAVSRRVREGLARRLVRVRGQWQLWVSCARWRLLGRRQETIGDSSSSRAIDRAVRFLDGQALSGAQLVRRPFSTVLDFDLGARLEIRPHDRTGELWVLYEPGGTVLTVRADRRYAHAPATARNETWKRIWRSGGGRRPGR